ncbi:MAG: hypothetical protein IKW20_04505 [Bacteroidales bacterium]|nr:hypothetical protein [Bacteroidales bacterium]
MKKPDVLKPKRLYEKLSPNIPDDYHCTIVHAYYEDRRFYIISQMFTGGEDEELYYWFNVVQTEKLMMKFQTHDPETFMYRLRERFGGKDGGTVISSFTDFCDGKGIEYIVTVR